MATVTQTQTITKSKTHLVAPKSFPSKWWSYVELTRANIWFQFFIASAAFLHGSIYAACVIDEQISLPQLLWTLAKLFFSSILTLSWACTWNDVADYDLDRHVERCRNRPIASGAISPTAAVVFTIVQLAFWALYHSIALPGYSVWGLFLVIGSLLYPFSKRVTTYTPVVLGVIFAWGAPLGYVATGGDLSEVAQLTPRGLGVVALFMYHLVWVINYETIYAFQDMADDMKAGINSMAVKYRNHATPLFVSSIVLETLSLFVVGKLMDATFGYYLFATCLTAFLQFWLQMGIDTRKPKQCTSFFIKIPLTSTLPICVGLLADFLSK